MVVSLLLGPIASSAAARAPLNLGPSSSTFWTCYPNGSTPEAGPTTTISSALLFPDPSKDAISCFFPNVTPTVTGLFGGGIQFGGDCYFNEGSRGVEFMHRIYVVHGNTASLACWDGMFVECQVAGVKSSSVAQCPTSSARNRRNPA